MQENLGDHAEEAYFDAVMLPPAARRHSHEDKAGDVPVILLSHEAQQFPRKGIAQPAFLVIVPGGRHVPEYS